MKKDIGLVCEGGGLRGMYTAGILDYFLEMGLKFPNLIGVSAGAIYLSSYISKQKGRNFEIQKKYINDHRYMSFRNLIKTGNFFDPDFAYFKMAKELFPFDYDTFKVSKTNYQVGTFNCLTGKTDFHSKENFSNLDETITALLASGSLPFLSKEVMINNIPYLDGGIGSPIPIEKSILDGNKKHLVILTQGENYRKKPLKYPKFTNFFYKRYPFVANALINRHKIYNNTLNKLSKLQDEKSVFILRPSIDVKVGRLEKDKTKIEDLYNLGYEDAKQNYNDIINWINN